MKMKKSKNIRHGKLCTWKGDKLILAGKRTKKLAGIWVMAGTKIIIDENFKKHTIDNPAGLQIFGATESTFVVTTG